MKRDLYVAFIGAKGAAFSWIGAGLGPVFCLVGLATDSCAHALIGIGMLLVVAISIRDGLIAYKYSIDSDFVVLAVIPIVLMLCGFGFAYAAYKGYV